MSECALSVTDNAKFRKNPHTWVYKDIVCKWTEHITIELKYGNKRILSPWLYWMYYYYTYNQVCCMWLLLEHYTSYIYR